MSSSRHTDSPRRGVRQLLKDLILGGKGPEDPKRGRLLLEALERRQLLAGDVELLFTEGVGEDNSQPQPAEVSSSGSSILRAVGQAEGELAPDLVQFAKDLAASGAEFFGAAWCPFCTEQKQLFEDGGDYLPFIEVTNPDRTLNAIGQQEEITSFPTWKFPGQSEPVTGVLTLQQLSQLSGVPIPQSEDPTFQAIGGVTVQIGSPLHIPVDAYDSDGGPLTVSVSVADPSLLDAVVLSGNRSIRIDMEGYGDMVFELFEDRAPVAAGRVIQLANLNFYDGIIFHRIVDGFVIQGGDPTGTGTSGSSFGNFDDDYHPDLQHNREGVLSFAKSSDDTNNSQFFITEVPTRFLDFNHSIFGQLVEGFDVREAISNTSTPESRGAGSSQKPDVNITMTSIDVFDDTENAVVMLKAKGTSSGNTSVTFTVTDQDGNSHSETVQVSVVADTANSQPFLNDIATPAPTPTGSVAQLQLSSVDVEGDAVTYFAQSLSSASNGTVSVNPNTGLVSVTPAASFVGTIDVQVGVRPGPGVVGNGPSDSDTQRVSFIFEGESVLAPTSVDLQAGSDSGSSATDNITNVGSLSFLVSGVNSGASVELVDTTTSTVIGTGLASGTTIVITTSNVAALGDGTYQIAARQTLASETSDLSPSLTLTYDATPPASVVGSAGTQANAGRAFETDLISTEEGSGLVYSLVDSPEGASINASTGLVQWTPTVSQIGENLFTLGLTDRAGNELIEDFTVSVAPAPTVEIRLEITDLNDEPLTSIATGQEFLLRMIAVDAREEGKKGVYAAFADIEFDNTLVRPVPGSTIEYDGKFSLLQKGTFSTGLIDELGAVNAFLAATNDEENLIATVRMEAIGQGTVNILSSPADDVNSEVLLFGVDERIPASAVAYGSVNLAIGQSFTLQDDTKSIAEDSPKTTINVLQNDTVVSGNGSLTVISVTQPASGGVASLDNGVVSFTPNSNFNGKSIFTYRVSDSNGIQDSAAVTVTVTPVNDAPVAEDDDANVDTDSGVNFLNVLGNDTFAPDTGETLRVSAIGSTTTANGGTVSIAANGSGVNYQPAAGFVGIDTFTYTVSDGSLTDVATVTVTVAVPDNPPTAVDNAFPVVEDDPEKSFDILSNDTRDIDNQPFVIHSLGTPSNDGSVRFSSDGLQFFYEPADDFAGTETVTYTIRDTGGGLSTGTVTFNVTPVNDPPPIANPNVVVNRGTGSSVVFSIDDLPDNVDSNETLELSVTDNTTSAGGSAILSESGDQILYTPPAEFVGTDTIDYTVDDGSGGTSSGTITIEVSDFTQRNIEVTLPGIASAARIGGITLTGTDLLGNTVERSIEYDDDKALFKDLFPGSYTVQIAANPFLQNASEPKSIPLTSEPDDGDAVIESGIGRLRPEYVSIQDWLGSTPRQAVLAVVSPGNASTFAVASSESGLEDPSVSLDGSGSLLTVVAMRTNPTSGTAGATEQQATVSTSDKQQAQLRGEADGFFLYRIATEELSFTDVPTGSSSQPEGELLAFDALNVLSSSQAAEGEQVPASSPLIVSGRQAEGEYIAASASTQVDAFVPVSDSVSTRTDATVLPLSQGELWVGESMMDDDDSSVQSFDSQSIDSAMQNVTDELAQISQAGDALADQIALEQELQAAAIDEAFSSVI